LIASLGYTTLSQHRKQKTQVTPKLEEHDTETIPGVELHSFQPAHAIAQQLNPLYFALQNTQHLKKPIPTTPTKNPNPILNNPKPNFEKPINWSQTHKTKPKKRPNKKRPITEKPKTQQNPEKNREMK
jgi:hypothetical protein